MRQKDFIATQHYQAVAAQQDSLNSAIQRRSDSAIMMEHLKSVDEYNRRSQLDRDIIERNEAERKDCSMRCQLAASRFNQEAEMVRPRTLYLL